MSERDVTERLLFISRVRRPGDEARARETAERQFPAAAFERAGLVGFTVHVGGGYCVFEYGYEGPFTPIFERVDADAAIQAYLSDLAEHVDPAPRVHPGSTADQPVAADQFIWRKGETTKTRSPDR